MVDGELVAHLAVTPRFEIKGFRATRLVVMPEWQGAGVGTRFLNWVCAFHKAGGGRQGKEFPTYFHTSHPQLVQFLKRSKDWRQVSAMLLGANKADQKKRVASKKTTSTPGAGGHFRAVQGFKYIGK